MTDTRDDGSVEYAVERASETVLDCSFTTLDWLRKAQSRLQSGAYRSNAEAGRIAAGALANCLRTAGRAGDLIEHYEAALQRIANLTNSTRPAVPRGFICTQFLRDAATAFVQRDLTAEQVGDALEAICDIADDDSIGRKPGEASNETETEATDGIAAADAGMAGRPVGADRDDAVGMADLTPPSEDGERVSPRVLARALLGLADRIDGINEYADDLRAAACTLRETDHAHRRHEPAADVVGAGDRGDGRGAADDPGGALRKGHNGPHEARGTDPLLTWGGEPERASEEVCGTCGDTGEVPIGDSDLYHRPCPGCSDTPALTERERQPWADWTPPDWWAGFIEEIREDVDALERVHGPEGEMPMEIHLSAQHWRRLIPWIGLDSSPMSNGKHRGGASALNGAEG